MIGEMIEADLEVDLNPMFGESECLPLKAAGFSDILSSFVPVSDRLGAFPTLAWPFPSEVTKEEVGGPIAASYLAVKDLTLSPLSSISFSLLLSLPLGEVFSVVEPKD